MKNALLVFAVLFLAACQKPQEELSLISGQDLLQHWVLTNENPEPDEVLNYVPFDEELEIPLHQLYGGWEFMEQEEMIQYTWIWCGTPPVPDNKTYGTWDRSNGGINLHVKINDVVKVYEVSKLTSDQLHLKPL